MNALSGLSTTPSDGQFQTEGRNWINALGSEFRVLRPTFLRLEESSEHEKY